MAEPADWEEERFERILGLVVDAARVKFYEARQDGKRGWDSRTGWSYPGEPLDRAKQEIEEVRDATSKAGRLREAGDVLNFLVFDYSLKEAGGFD